MKILGLTGDIAAGKSTVAQMLVERGAAHLDADKQVHSLYAQPAFAQLVSERFGDVLDAHGQVDRTQLGALVFSVPEKLRELELLVHPLVAQMRERDIEELRVQNTPAVVVEAVKLLESGQTRGMDEVWCVTAWKSVQMERLMSHRHLSRDEAEKRLHVQPSPEAKRTLAKPTPLIFLPNNGTLGSLETRVEREWQRFLAS